MELKIAKIVSVLFHPLLIPAYTTLLLFNLNSYIAFQIPYQAKLLILGMIVITTFFFPVLFILIMKRRGMIKSLQMENREERLYPFIITAIFYFLTYQMIRQLQIPDVYKLFILGSAILVLLSMGINFFMKISIHMVGIGGMLGALIGLSLHINLNMVYSIILIIVISGIVGFSRLKLDAHKPLQVYSGFLMGVAVMSLVLLF
ncbi:MAG: hypothetical protein R2764_12220 [Bacteroidales bacterium]